MFNQQYLVCKLKYLQPSKARRKRKGPLMGPFRAFFLSDERRIDPFFHNLRRRLQLRLFHRKYPFSMEESYYSICKSSICSPEGPVKNQF